MKNFVSHKAKKERDRNKKKRERYLWNAAGSIPLQVLLISDSSNTIYL